MLRLRSHIMHLWAGGRGVSPGSVRLATPVGQQGCQAQCNTHHLRASRGGSGVMLRSIQAHYNTQVSITCGPGGGPGGGGGGGAGSDGCGLVRSIQSAESSG